MRVLLLNSSYEPLKIVSWKKAVILIYKEKAQLLEEYDNLLIRSPNLVLKAPSVIRLYYYVNINKYKILRFSKENIFFRDNYTCAYCGNKFNKSQLTLDHIIPYSKGGRKTWTNIVTACNYCNNKKGSYNLDQVNFRLLNKPFKPSENSYIAFHNKFHTIPVQWRNYLPIGIIEMDTAI